MQKLSLVLITKNAADQLGPCLDSAQALVDEIIVVDSGSSDDTLALAERYGARVTRQDFLGFGPQKRLAVSLASHDWVLCLDADERLTPELAGAIRSALAQPSHGAYRIARRNRFFGRYLRHGEGYPDWNIRLFDRRQANWTEHAVHEHVLCPKGAGELRGDLLHDSAERLASYLEKQNRYTDIQAHALFQQGRRVGPGKLLGAPLARFLRFYLLKRGWQDGAAGFAHIAIGSFFAFVKYAKLMEHWRQHDERKP
ncbi:glycosyltransferase family 2 protein [Chitinimonas viridis]|uniref:Glycosyltransferase family 2 protein n=1 Tax=Chitinimonas viridis TaxID=664880 RepID=A0ABT8B8U1_9NEIS|nr:glycosyltransferase family 2 protein [Chitinimonas viridis]MDN3578657.1 glycosyltransferase family 2 protein [Chitinimonas viridis]